MEKKEEEEEESNPFQPAECLEEDTEGFFSWSHLMYGEEYLTQ